MITPEEATKVLAPLSFRMADKFFKFVSWIIIINLIRYAHKVTGSNLLWWLEFVAVQVFGLALILQAFYVAVRDPTTLGFSGSMIRCSRLLQFVASLVMLSFLIAPTFNLDRIMDALSEARPK